MLRRTSRRLVPDVVAGKQRRASGRLDYRGQQAQGGGLARAIRAQESENLSRPYLEGHFVNCPDRPALRVLEGLGEAAYLDHRILVILSRARRGCAGPELAHSL